MHFCKEKIKKKELLDIIGIKMIISFINLFLLAHTIFISTTKMN